ncbi:MAG: DUF3394 domain-containing protein, partial [Sneathiella sp.]|nr:DUF3394 domain-containing protein [Sneathiella sp.]
APSNIESALGGVETGAEVRLIVLGENDIGDPITITAVLPIEADGSGAERLQALGLEILIEGETVIIDDAAFDSIALKAGLDFDQKILTVLLPSDQPAKSWLYIPALLALGFIVLLQRRRNGTPLAKTVPVS